MENEIISINKEISPIGSIDKWFSNRSTQIDRVEAAYRSVRRDPLFEVEKSDLVQMSDESQRSLEISDEQYDDLMTTRVELSLRKLSGEKLDLFEQRTLDSLNSLLSNHIKAKYDYSESIVLKKMSAELKDILDIIKK